MALRIKKAEVIIGDKHKLILAKDVKEMGFVAPGAFAVDLGTGEVLTYWNCPVVLTQEDIPEIIEVPKIVEAS